jgi:hypothetical protein
LIQFIKDLLNPNGPVSFGRFMALIMTTFVLGWDTAILVHNHTLVPGTELMLQAGFCVTFYGVTKAVELKNNPANPPV